MSVDLAVVVAKHLENAHNYRGSGRQFLEGPNNENPWGREQGIANASYCDSGASMVPYDAGYRWWPESQFGEKGCAYTVSHVQVGQAHAEIRFEFPSDPCDVEPGDLLFYDWSGGKGSASIVDHVETAIERRVAGGRTHNVGYNTGSPGGCYDLWRDGKYLVCRLRPLRNGGYGGSTPTPRPRTQEDDMAAIRIPHPTTESRRDPDGNPAAKRPPNEYYERGTVGLFGKGVGKVTCDESPKTDSGAGCRIAIGSPGNFRVEEKWIGALPFQFAYDESKGDKMVAVTVYGLTAGDVGVAVKSDA